LSVAFKSSQSSVRTSEDMPFTLGYASAKKEEWGASVNVQARDKAKPVLADTVFLHIGDLRDDYATADTLRVTYSERPGNEALALDRPIMIQTSGDPCQPNLKLIGQVVPTGGSSRFYKATYVIDGDLAQQCPAFPETGNMVKIDAGSGFGDDRDPPNIQDMPDNLKQPLKVVREQKWTVMVKNNPFKSDVGGWRKVTVEISPNAAGVKNVSIDATIKVFDKTGKIVKLDTMKRLVVGRHQPKGPPGGHGHLPVQGDMPGEGAERLGQRGTHAASAGGRQVARGGEGQELGLGFIGF